MQVFVNSSYGTEKACGEAVPLEMPVGSAAGLRGLPWGGQEDVPAAWEVPGSRGVSADGTHSALAPGTAKLPLACATWGASFRTFIVLYNIA